MIVVSTNCYSQGVISFPEQSFNIFAYNIDYAPDGNDSQKGTVTIFAEEVFYSRPSEDYNPRTPIIKYLHTGNVIDKITIFIDSPVPSFSPGTSFIRLIEIHDVKLIAYRSTGLNNLLDLYNNKNPSFSFSWFNNGFNVEFKDNDQFHTPAGIADDPYIRRQNFVEFKLEFLSYVMGNTVSNGGIDPEKILITFGWDYKTNTEIQINETSAIIDWDKYKFKNN